MLVEVVKLANGSDMSHVAMSLKHPGGGVIVGEPLAVVESDNVGEGVGEPLSVAEVVDDAVALAVPVGAGDGVTGAEPEERALAVADAVAVDERDSVGEGETLGEGVALGLDEALDVDEDVEVADEVLVDDGAELPSTQTGAAAPVSRWST